MARRQVRDVDMPVLMRAKRLHESGSFLRPSFVPAIQPPRAMQHAIHRRGTARHEVPIDHPKRQASISFQRMLRVEIENGLFLLGQKPVVARNPGVVFVDRAAAVRHAENLARAMPNHATRRAHGSSVRSCSDRKKSTTTSRRSGATHCPLSGGQPLFLRRSAPRKARR